MLGCRVIVLGLWDLAGAEGMFSPRSELWLQKRGLELLSSLPLCEAGEGRGCRSEQMKVKAQGHEEGGCTQPRRKEQAAQPG